MTVVKHVDDVTADVFEHWSEPGDDFYDLVRSGDLQPRLQDVRVGDRLEIINVDAHKRPGYLYGELPSLLFEIGEAVKVRDERFYGSRFKVQLRRLDHT